MRRGEGRPDLGTIKTERGPTPYDQGQPLGNIRTYCQHCATVCDGDMDPPALLNILSWQIRWAAGVISYRSRNPLLKSDRNPKRAVQRVRGAIPPPSASCGSRRYLALNTARAAAHCRDARRRFHIRAADVPRAAIPRPPHYRSLPFQSYLWPDLLLCCSPTSLVLWATY